MLRTPWVIHDVEIALWPAWKDGMPFAGPGARSGGAEPLFRCKSSLSIVETFEAGAVTGHDWRAAVPPAGSMWKISVGFPDGAHADEFGRVLARVEPGGLRILTALFSDGGGEWTKLSFFYVTPDSDSSSDSGELIGRSVSLQSSWRSERVGTGSPPGMAPEVRCEVEWVCGARRVTALTYDPLAEVWESTAQNETGDGSRYVTLGYVSEDEHADMVLAAYLPRIEPAPVVGDELASHRISWQNTLLLRIGGHDSENHHGLSFPAGHALQAIGIVEPLVMYSQDRVIDEPVVVFSCLRRVYAVIGHGVLAVPSFVENEDPPLSHDPAIRLAVTGDANPATGQSGLVLLPSGAWLDGALLD